MIHLFPGMRRHRTFLDLNKLFLLDFSLGILFQAVSDTKESAAHAVDDGQKKVEGWADEAKKVDFIEKFKFHLVRHPYRT